jgi:hypothetical protein
VIQNKVPGHWEKPQYGIILGRRAAGYIKALFIRLKLKLSRAPLIKLLTIYQEYCIELKLDQILEFKDIPNLAGKIVFRVLYKELKEIYFSKVIILVKIFTIPFLTMGSNG